MSPAGVTLASMLAFRPSAVGTVDTGLRGVARASAVRGESEQVRRTTAIIAAGALVLLAGCSGDDSGAGSRDAAAAAPDAQVSLALADGSADVSPVQPL